MSESAKKAVFLSYASQDGEAAQRICEALRAAGIEVWFDQNELVGGDAWDAKIRGQIASCALFVPIISANTQARGEGYFRLEWKLAVDRSHLMAHDQAFLLPIVIDGTTDAAARVPPEFRAVQWTRLAGGEGSAAFCRRVNALLGGPEETGNQQPKANAAAEPHARRRPRGAGWFVAAAGLVAVAGIALWLRGPRSAAPPSPPPTLASGGPAAAEIAAVRARIIPDRWQKEDFDAVSSTLDRIIGANADAADAWALRSIINSLQVTRNYESGTAPLAVGKQAADRAVRLAPSSPLSELALGFHLMAMVTRGGDPHACRPYLDRALKALPRDPITRYVDLISAWQCYDLPRTERSAQAWLEEEPRATMPTWIMAQMHVVLRHPEEVERWAERALTEANVTGIRAFYTIFEAKYYLRADLAGARAALDRVPASGRLVHRVVHGRWLLAMAEGQWDDALQGLGRLTEPFLFDRSFHGPRALLAALAHQGAGRSDAAVIQFREAERGLRERLAADPENDELHAELAVTLAGLGRAAEARSELALVEPLVTGRVPSIYRGPQIIPVAQARAILRDTERLNFWLRKLLAEPAGPAFTPAALRFDPRFKGLLEAPETQALLREFEHLNRAVTSPANPKSVAVLPFANLSGDPGQDYLSDGLTVEIQTALSSERDLRVPGATSGFAFKGKSVPVPEIARALSVAQVVEGTVRKSGDQVKITVSLTRASDGFSEPLGTFTEKLEDVFALQEKVARAVVEKITKRTNAVGVAVLTKVPAAYDAYLRGRSAQMQSQRLWRQAQSFYEQATQLDPGFALAWARLAEVRFVDYRSGIDRAPATLASIQAALDHALQLQPDLPTALVVRASIARVAREDLVAAGADLERAGQLQSAMAEVRFAEAYVARDRGEWPVAFRLAHEGLELSPRDGDMANVMAFIFWNRGDYLTADRMLVQAAAAADAGITAAFQNRVNLRHRWRGADAALRVWDATAKGRSDSQLAGIHLLLAAGRTEEARQQFMLVERTADWSGVARSSSVFVFRMLEMLGRDSLARQLAEQWRVGLKARLEQGDTGHYTRSNFISCEIALGNTTSAARELERWRNDAVKLKSVYRQFDEFQDRAAPLYAWLGDREGAIAIVSDYLEKGFQPGYLLRDPLAFPSVAKDPRWQRLIGRAEAWARAQPDPIDP